MLRDFTVPITRDLVCRVIERPGAWMANDRLAALVHELRDVAAATVAGGALTYGVLTGERPALARSIVTVIYQRGLHRALAFSAMAWLPVTVDGRATQVLHMGLALVRADARGRKLSRSLYALSVLAAFIRRGCRGLWMSNVSQVPSAIGSFASYFSRVYPAAGGARPTRAHQQIAAQLMEHHRAAFGVGADAEFDAAHFVIRNAYTGGSDNLKKSFAQATHHRDAAIERLCLEQLDYQRGDDFLQVGRYTAFVVLRCLARRLRLWYSHDLQLRSAYQS